MSNQRKKILIIGADSYMGTCFAAYADQQFEIFTLDARNQNWDEVDMSGFDTVLHVAGIAHVKQTRQRKPLYYQINRDLVETVANKAKAGGIRQFIFISTLAVQANDPNDYYGDSKRQAEIKLNALHDDSFQVAIVRPPMVYGSGCKGNFPKLVKLTYRTPLFPHIKNARSIIYIDNLCAFLCRIVENGQGGLYHPQNKAYNCTTHMVQRIAAHQGKKIRTTRLFNFMIYALMPLVPAINKLFASYTHPLSGDEEAYNVVDYEESIRVSVCTLSSNE
ncbi:MAG: NAD-dependent epimerase/dehydratase family protein [Defluviitaleaceae bacterium]|nr:NAD-dependent epimerase/dehydratase family protein [Defluviitaleaceae bacterium]